MDSNVYVYQIISFFIFILACFTAPQIIESIQIYQHRQFIRSLERKSDELRARFEADSTLIKKELNESRE